MAKAKRIVEEKEVEVVVKKKQYLLNKITLELSVDEALVAQAIMGNITSGTGNENVREKSGNIYYALREALFNQGSAAIVNVLTPYNLAKDADEKLAAHKEKLFKDYGVRE